MNNSWVIFFFSNPDGLKDFKKILLASLNLLWNVKH